MAFAVKIIDRALRGNDDVTVGLLSFVNFVVHNLFREMKLLSRKTLFVHTIELVMNFAI